MIASPKGRIQIIGLGPGAPDLVTPQVQTALFEATDIIGYSGYLARLPKRSAQIMHPSDNRQELKRAAHAFALASAGRQVVIASSGDPGVFAMAAAVFESLDHGPSSWRAISIEILPGITAMLAASARVGAPLGHDFCAINLSDNLKSFAVIELRVRMAVRGDFVMALYNPRSRARPDTCAQIMDIIRTETDRDLLLILAKNVFCADESITITSLSRVDVRAIDMRTVVLVGNRSTKHVKDSPFIYTPRKEQFGDQSGEGI